VGGGRRTFAPTSPVSREAMAAFLHRADALRWHGRRRPDPRTGQHATVTSRRHPFPPATHAMSAPAALRGHARLHADGPLPGRAV